jgi:hypothetical protein
MANRLVVQHVVTAPAWALIEEDIEVPELSPQPAMA